MTDQRRREAANNVHFPKQYTEMPPFEQINQPEENVSDSGENKRHTDDYHTAIM